MTWGGWTSIVLEVLAVCVRQMAGVSRQEKLTDYQAWLTPAAKRERAETVTPSDQFSLRTIIRFWPLACVAFGVFR